jgi:hypothetical protein
MTDWSDIPSSAYHRAHILLVGCKTYYTPEQVTDLLTYATSLTGKAKTAFEVKGWFDTLSKAEAQLQKAVGDIDAKLKQAKHLAAIADAGCTIAAAIGVLETWDPQGNSRTSSADAAKAFDKLFGGVAHFMGYLPAPLNQYKSIFDGIAEYGFFSSLQAKLDPGGSGSTSGRMQQQIDKIPELGRH